MTAAGQMQFCQYRRVTGQQRYDSDVERAVQSLAPSQIKEIGADVSIIRKTRPEPEGIGKQTDMPIWNENGKLRQHSPILLSVAANIASDQDLAKCSVDLARTYFELAVDHFPDRRNHGCAANTVSTIARGHGRENNAGMTTGVLHPIIEGFQFRDDLISAYIAEQGDAPDAFAGTGDL